MKVLIYEPYRFGHRLHYAALIISALREIGCDVSLATSPSTMRSEEYRIHLNRLESQFSIVETTETAGSAGRIAATFQREEGKRFALAIELAQPDHLLVPTATQFSTAFAKSFLFRKSFAKFALPAEGLHMSPGYGYPSLPKRRRVMNVLQMFAEKNLPWSTYHHLDPFQLAAIQGGESKSEKYSLMPDPAPLPPDISKSAARKHFGIPTDVRYVGCAGALGMDKGIVEMMEAFRIALPRLDAQDRFLLAGNCSPDVRRHIEQHGQDLIRSGQMILLDRHLSEYEMDIVLTAFDLICAAQHWRPGSSGIILRAAAAGIPVLARNRYWSGKVVPMFDLGWTCRTWDVKSFADNLVSRMRELGQFQQSESTRRFVKFHSVENFQATWLTNIRQRMNLPPDPRKIDWNWVLEKQAVQYSSRAPA